MADADKVQDLLFARANAVAQAVGLPISFPEPKKTFTPPEDGKYLVATLLRNAPRFVAVRGPGLDQGILTMTVVWPKNDGEVRPAAIGRQVRDLMMNNRLAGGGARVKVGGDLYVASPVPDPARVMIPVTIPWTA